MVIQVDEKPFAATIRYAARQYSRRINVIQSRSGHLIERRHRLVLVREDAFLSGLVRYIHYNPVRAGMVAHADAYRWGSHAIYAGERTSTLPGACTGPKRRSANWSLGIARLDDGNVKNVYTGTTVLHPEAGIELEWAKESVCDPKPPLMFIIVDDDTNGLRGSTSQTATLLQCKSNDTYNLLPQRRETTWD
jgi:hypothetical protein